MSEADIINGKLDAVVAAYRRHREHDQNQTDICRAGGCVFPLWHEGMHSWKLEG